MDSYEFNFLILMYLITSSSYQDVLGCSSKRISCLSETSYKFCFIVGKMVMDIGNIKYCPENTVCNEIEGSLPCLKMQTYPELEGASTETIELLENEIISSTTPVYTENISDTDLQEYDYVDEPTNDMDIFDSTAYDNKIEFLKDKEDLNNVEELLEKMPVPTDPPISITTEFSKQGEPNLTTTTENVFKNYLLNTEVTESFNEEINTSVEFTPYLDTYISETLEDSTYLFTTESTTDKYQEINKVINIDYKESSIIHLAPGSSTIRVERTTPQDVSTTEKFTKANFDDQATISTKVKSSSTPENLNNSPAIITYSIPEVSTIPAVSITTTTEKSTLAEFRSPATSTKVTSSATTSENSIVKTTTSSAIATKNGLPLVAPTENATNVAVRWEITTVTPLVSTPNSKFVYEIKQAPASLYLGIIGLLTSTTKPTTQSVCQSSTITESAPNLKTDSKTTTTSTESYTKTAHPAFNFKTYFSNIVTTTTTTTTTAATSTIRGLIFTKASLPICRTTGRYPSRVCNQYYECVRIMWWLQARLRTCRYGDAFNPATLRCHRDISCRGVYQRT